MSLDEARRVDFYFDFSSPYAYLAAQSIDRVVATHGRTARWAPIRLGVIFRAIGLSPHVGVPLKWAYVTRDLARAAKKLDVPFKLPAPFPFDAQVATAAYWALESRDPSRAVTFARDAFARAFTTGESLTPDVVAELAPHLKEAERAAGAERALQETERAKDRGVFGSPFFIAEGEPFWGQDRIRDLDAFLAEMSR